MRKSIVALSLCSTLLPPHPPSPHRPRAWEKLGGSDAVHLFIYLSRSFISRYKWPWRLTTTESPTPAVLPLPQTWLVCEEGVINIKNTQISEEQWIQLEAGEGKLEVLTFFSPHVTTSKSIRRMTKLHIFIFIQELFILLSAASLAKISICANAKYYIYFFPFLLCPIDHLLKSSPLSYCCHAGQTFPLSQDSEQ